MKKYVVFDIECYPNYFLVLFQNGDKTYEFEILDNRVITGDFKTLKKFIPNYILVGYNSNSYDIPLLEYVCSNKGVSDNKLIYEKSQKIRKSKSFPSNKSLDLMSLLFNVNPKGLKMLGCSLKLPKLQDLPYHFSNDLTYEESQSVKLYCYNDVTITKTLFETKEIQDKIKIRLDLEKQGFKNILSKSDSGLGNVIVKKWYSDITGLEESEFKDSRTFRDKLYFKDALYPNVVNGFQTEEGKNIVNTLSEIIVDTSKYNKETKQKGMFPSFKIFGLKLQFGIGGIHSEDNANAFYEDDSNYIYDYDIKICVM